MKIMIDETSYKQKPDVNDIKSIKNRLNQKNSIKERTIQELFSKDIPSGHTILPAIMNGGVKNNNFVQQELIIIDVDQDKKTDYKISPEEAIEKSKELGLEPVGYHYSFSSTLEDPRYHLVYRLNEPITDVDKIHFVINTLLEVIGNSDIACKDAARIFFTTNGEEQKVVLLNENAVITFDDIIRINQKKSILKGNNDNLQKNNDLKKAIENFDLLNYVVSDCHYEVSSNNSTYTMLRKCPICGHNDCFVIYKQTNTFYCFGKNGQCGGSIIQYLMKRKNLDKKTAIEHFMYEILKWPKKNLGSAVVISSDKKNNYLEIIKNQMKEIKFENDQLGDLSWIEEIEKKDGSTFTKINCPKLYDFIRRNVHYIFVREHAKGGVLRYFYIDGYYKLISNDDIKGIIKSFIPLELMRVVDVNEVYNFLITDMKFVSIETLNKEEHLINFKNGLLNLKTRKLEAHNPKYLITTRINGDYIENPLVPINRYFDRYMDDLTGKNEALKLLYLEIMGVTISNIYAYRMKKAVFQVGERDTGKSRLKLFLRRLIGEQNFSGLGLKELESRFGRISLLDKRLVGSNDLSAMSLDELEIFKQATGGDVIYAEFKGENSINIIFKGLLWFCCNQLPNFTGDRSEAVYSRMIVVECKNVIPPEKQDKFLDDHLFEEKDYIISQAIKALYKVIDNGYRYDIPEICENWKKKYKTNNHSFLLFMEECIIDRPPGPIKDDCTCKKLYEVYKEWCKSNVKSGKSETKKEVNNLLNSIGKGECKKTNGGYIYYQYITLSEEAKLEYATVYNRRS